MPHMPTYLMGFQAISGEACYRTSTRLHTKNELGNENSDFLQALYSAYEKLGQLFFHTYTLTCLKRKIHQICL